jgi:hypothetical protein
MDGLDENSLDGASKSAESVLSDYHVPEIISGDFKISEMVFCDKSGRTYRLKIPQNLLFDAVVSGVRAYINSHLYQKKYSWSAVRRHFNVFEDVINIATKEGRVNTSIGFDVLNNIKKRTDSETIIFHHLNAFTSVLNNAINKNVIDAGLISHEQSAEIRRVSANAPRPKRPQSEKAPSLEKLYDSKYNNIEIQKALRVWCSRFLIEWSYIRHQFKRMMPNEYQMILDRLQYQREIPSSLDVTSTGLSLVNLTPSEDRDALDQMSYIYLKFATEYKHPFLIDDVFATLHLSRVRHQRTSKTNLFPEFLADDSLSKYRIDISIETMLKELNSWKGSETSVVKKLNRDSGNLRFRRCPTAASLIAPSYEEIIVMTWLLASDDQQRQQRQNILGAKLNDLEEFCHRRIPAIKPNFFKGRSNRTTGAPINKNTKNDVYSALALMKNGISEGYCLGIYDRKISSIDSNTNLVPKLTNMHAKYFRSKLRAFGMDNSLSRKHMNELCECTGINISPVNQIIREALITRKTIVDTVLSLNAIAETSLSAFKASRIKALPKVSKNFEINPENKDIHEADVHALVRNHTLKTQVETYFFRSEDRIKLDNDYKFAKLVGDEMVKMAISLANHKSSKTKVMSIKDVEALLGIKPDTSQIESDINAIYETAGIQRYLVDKTGLIEREGDVIVMKTPFVAHLLSRFIDHIDGNLESILLSNYEYALKLLAHRMFLKCILVDHFDRKIIQQGKSMYGEYAFPFPDYMGL